MTYGAFLMKRSDSTRTTGISMVDSVKCFAAEAFVYDRIDCLLTKDVYSAYTQYCLREFKDSGVKNITCIRVVLDYLQFKYQKKESNEQITKIVSRKGNVLQHVRFRHDFRAKYPAPTK